MRTTIATSALLAASVFAGPASAELTGCLSQRSGTFHNFAEGDQPTRACRRHSDQVTIPTAVSGKTRINARMEQTHWTQADTTGESPAEFPPSSEFAHLGDFGSFEVYTVCNLANVGSGELFDAAIVVYGHWLADDGPSDDRYDLVAHIHHHTGATAGATVTHEQVSIPAEPYTTELLRVDVSTVGGPHGYACHFVGTIEHTILD